MGQIQLDPGAVHPVLQRRLSISNWPCMDGAPMGLKGGSRDVGMRSYQVPSKTQGTHVREDIGGAWGRFIKIHGTCMHFSK